MTKLLMPEPPDDDEKKKKGPSRRTNEEKSLPSNETHGDDPPETTEGQDNAEEILRDMAEEAPVPLEPEKLSGFALTDDFDYSVAKKVLNIIRDKKPTKEAFVRTMPDEECWKLYPLLELKEEGKTYLLAPTIAHTLTLEGESTLIRARLVPTVDRRGNFFLWLLKTSDRENDWHISALRAAMEARERWIRVMSNMAAGCYDTFVAESQDAEPVWPEEDYEQILQIAFQGRIIKALDHPVLRELRGEF